MRAMFSITATENGNLVIEEYSSGMPFVVIIQEKIDVTTETERRDDVMMMLRKLREFIGRRARA